MSNNKRRRKKVGRNDRCPCGSGKKYKKCHAIASTTLPGHPSEEDIQKIFERLQASQKQRERQQGLGNPIISEVYQGYRFVAVGSKLYSSDKWKTFHDFLTHYLKDVFGSDWGQAELKKDPEKRHPIIQWLTLTGVYYRQQAPSQKGPFFSARMTGAVAAFMQLAYNLYVLAHNAHVQQRLIQRLKNPEQFSGALYETFVAAVFIRAGFELAFENEADGSQRHCEFTAVFKETGAKFSVEAKSRAAGKSNMDVGNQLYEALKKDASHARVVFIDINLADADEEGKKVEWWWDPVLKSLRSREESLTIAGGPAPPAYVFVTNTPYQYALESVQYKAGFISEGFKIPDFKARSPIVDLRTAVAAKKKHHEVHRLIQSMKEHWQIPSTFDGDIPELAFGDNPPRLKIGDTYMVKVNGDELPAELVDGAVLESEKSAYGIYRTSDGKQVINTVPLTDDELAAYRRHPDTFFGVYRPETKRVESSLDLFDLLHENYRNTPRSKLLEFLHDQPNFEALKDESQEELALIYCERLVYSETGKK